MTRPLRRQLGLAAVGAIVVGNMLGSGVFVTPGELAAIAERPWQVFFIWALCGAITLSGALTLAELCGRVPEAGASYHILDRSFGPLAAFVLVWLELWVSGPGAIAGIAVAFGEFARPVLGWSPIGWGVVAIGFFAAINLVGVAWGGRTQIVLTAAKVLGLVALIVGAFFFAPPAPVPAAPAARPTLGLVQFVGLGVAAVLFTYDGWIDVSHVAGEVRRPDRDLPLGLGLGVAGLTALYLIVNLAFLRVVPLDAMRAAPTTVANTVASTAFGPRGGSWLNGLMLVAMFGALGGLVLTLPRLYYTLAADQVSRARGPLQMFFRGLGSVSGRAVPSGAILFTAATAIVALLFFGSFSRLVNFFVVPLQLANMLMVAAVFRFRRLEGPPPGFHTPGYPVTPLVFVVVMAGFLVSAIVARPSETLLGVALAATGVPVYRWLIRR